MFPPGGHKGQGPLPPLSLKATVANVLTTTDYLERRDNNKKPFVSPSVTDSLVGHWGWGWGKTGLTQMFPIKGREFGKGGRLAPIGLQPVWCTSWLKVPFDLYVF